MTIVRKKMIQLLLCDYQRTVRCYTIYRTFKRWSSDGFTTILRLSATTIPAGALRLLLTFIGIGRKPEKRYGDSRQWFRAALRALIAGLPRRAGMVCGVLHCLAWIHKRAHSRTLIYLIIIGRLRWPVQHPAWRWYLVSVEVLRLTVCPPA